MDIDRGKTPLLQSELVAANRVKSEFLVRLSHELRIPLNSILGFAQVLATEQLAPAHLDSVEHIINSGYRLLELIDEVVDLARLDAGSLSVVREPVRVRETIGSAVELVRSRRDPQSTELTIDLAGTCDVHIRADRQRLRQIFAILITKIVETSELPKVVFNCYQTVTGRIRVVISNQDLGQHAIVPLPLDQLDDQPGNGGLSLMVAQRFIQAMGGSLEAERSHPERYRFAVEFGVLADPLDRLIGDGEAMRTLTSETSVPRQGTILYVEDNPSNRKLLERILTFRSGVRLITATQGEAGLEVAFAEQPDWIILDMHLPDITGEEVLQKIKGDDRTRHIPVTALSADATQGRISRVLAAGANGYLTKPIDVQRFLALFDRIMRPQVSELK